MRPQLPNVPIMPSMRLACYNILPGNSFLSISLSNPSSDLAATSPCAISEVILPENNTIRYNPSIEPSRVPTYGLSAVPSEVCLAVLSRVQVTVSQQSEAPSLTPSRLPASQPSRVPTTTLFDFELRRIFGKE